MLYPRENEVRAVLDLSGIWKFQLGDARDPGEACESLKDSEVISVPASYNDQKEDPHTEIIMAGFIMKERLLCRQFERTAPCSAF